MFGNCFKCAKLRTYKLLLLLRLSWAYSIIHIIFIYKLILFFLFTSHGTIAFTFDIFLNKKKFQLVKTGTQLSIVRASFCVALEKYSHMKPSMNFLHSIPATNKLWNFKLCNFKLWNFLHQGLNVFIFVHPKRSKFHNI